MSDAFGYLEEARGWAKYLIKAESRGNGDTENAMRRVAARHKGVKFSLLYDFRYRPPKDIMVGAFMALRNAYLAQCEKEMRRLQHAIEITKKTTGLDANSSFAIRAGVALAGEVEVPPEE